jgi:hypothetical protein
MMPKSLLWMASGHVRRQVPPLVERLPQRRLPSARPRMLRAQRQLVVDVHLVPRDFVDPDHRARGFEVVEPPPQLRFFEVDRQRGNLREFSDKAAQDFLLRRLKFDFVGGDGLGPMAGIVEHRILKEG